MQLPVLVKGQKFLPISPVVMANNLAYMRRTLGLPLSAVVVDAFDPFTDVGPFLRYSYYLSLAGSRDVAAILHQSGIHTRLVQQVRNPNFKPSQARLGGRVPDILAISYLQINSRAARALITDAHKLGEDRPFIICGGPKNVYEPAHAWNGHPDTWPDVVCTGPSHVMITLLTRLVALQRFGESLRKTFHRLRKNDELNDIWGLVFFDPNSRGLLNTGIAQLTEKLEHRPSMVTGLALYEQPGKHSGLSDNPLPLSHLKNVFQMIADDGTTRGCKFSCWYCPIPARMSLEYQVIDPDWFAENIREAVAKTGIKRFFEGDDNAFNDPAIEPFWENMAEQRIAGKTFRESGVWLGLEAVLANVQRRLHVLPLFSQAGGRGIWFGIEDLNALYINKGQNEDNIPLVFSELRRNGINPMAMTIMFSGQGWRGTPSHPFGVRETVEFLKANRATYFQMLHISPSPGSKAYEGYFKRREVVNRVGPYDIGDEYTDANRVIVESADETSSLLRRQLMTTAAYALFYSPANVLRCLIDYMNAPHDEVKRQDWVHRYEGLAQLLVTVWRYIPWFWALWRGPIEKHQSLPEPLFSIRSVQDEELIEVPKLHQLSA